MALLACLSGTKHMMKICTDFAEKCHILFNPNKSLLCYNLLSDAVSNVTVCGMNVYVRKKW